MESRCLGALPGADAPGGPWSRAALRGEPWAGVSALPRSRRGLASLAGWLAGGRRERRRRPRERGRNPAGPASLPAEQRRPLK